MSIKKQAKYRKDYRSPGFTVTHIDLDFNLLDVGTKVIAKSRIKQIQAGVDTLFLDGEALTLKRIEINGQAWAHYTEDDGGLTLTNLPNEFELLIETHIFPETNSTLEGLYLAEGAFCTQCEAEGFRRITYSLDRPDVLSKFTTKITANKNAFPQLLSNGNKLESGISDDGTHWALWEDPYAKPCYLFALVAGDFDLLADVYKTRSGRDVKLEIYVDKGNRERATYAMASLKNAMRWDETRFDLEYDLDIYMIVAVDFFNMGAMENKGLNVFNSKFVLANKDTATDADYQGIEAVIGHEYFHNWTGNRVTCRDWFQLSLKEGLTVFRDQEFSSDLGSRSVNRIKNVRTMRGPQFAQDRGPMSHPIRPEKVLEMNNFYTLTVYEKGSEVIRMLHRLMGEKRFQKGMRLYFDRHDGTAVTCEDFVKAMEDASGIDLVQFRLWYSQSGTPELTVRSEYDADASRLSLTVKQQTPETADQKEKSPLLIPFDIALYGADGESIKLQHNGVILDSLLHVTKEEETFLFDHVHEKPIIAMLSEFSAPVILNYDYSDDELVFLMQFAKNEFLRWDAGQMLLAKYIKFNITQCDSEKMGIELPESVLLAFKAVLQNKDLDLAFIAEMFNIPSENEIAGWFVAVDIDKIHAVRKGIKQRFATALKDVFFNAYFVLKQTDESLTHEAMAKRALRNVCLSYLAMTPEGEDLVFAQFVDSSNMTDTVAALAAANVSSLLCREKMMADFSEKWTQDGLVMDKWFMMQGTNPEKDALQHIKSCMLHPAFSLKNPNRIRALIGTFCNQNPVRFNEKDGSGYAFLGDILVQLNRLNPQVASRLLDPLLTFNHLDAPRQVLVHAQLLRLAALEDLADDLYEKVNKALEVSLLLAKM